MRRDNWQWVDEVISRVVRLSSNEFFTKMTPQSFKCLIVSVLFALNSFSSNASFQKDSTALAKLYTDALQHPDQLNDYLQQADQLFGSKQQTQDWKASYYYLKARFFVQTGQFKTVAKLSNRGAIKLKTAFYTL